MVEPAGPVRTFLQAESYEHYYHDYVEAAPAAPGGYALVAVHGKARAAALRRAFALVRPSGGVVVLANSQRPQYLAAVKLMPPQWLSHTSGDERGATTVLVARPDARQAAAANASAGLDWLNRRTA